VVEDGEVSLEQYVDQVAGGPWRAAARQAAELMSRTTGLNYPPHHDPDQDICLKTLALIVYAVAHNAGVRHEVTVGQLADWTAPYVQQPGESTAERADRVIVDLDRMQADLAVLLQHGGDELPPAGLRAGIVCPMDPISATWWSLVDWSPDPPYPDEFGSDWAPGPNLGYGLRYAVDIIRAAAAPQPSPHG